MQAKEISKRNANVSLSQLINEILRNKQSHFLKFLYPIWVSFTNWIWYCISWWFKYDCVIIVVLGNQGNLEIDFDSDVFQKLEAIQSKLSQERKEEISLSKIINDLLREALEGEKFRINNILLKLLTFHRG